MAQTFPKAMPALCKLDDAPGLSFQADVAIPTVGPREVLIAVTHAGICGTDRHIYEWDAWSRSRVRLGITTGHEFVGRVAALGSAVTRTEIGPSTPDGLNGDVRVDAGFELDLNLRRARRGRAAGLVHGQNVDLVVEFILLHPKSKVSQPVADLPLSNLFIPRVD